ncbi:hypothetical protein GCM10022393_25020 [Aquimarina addita]|uniref:SRPBCC family protein n=1 Tax=Aquimarina addita TaxID=870485 RepID=A0ABP6ULC5_9FLAO
MKLLFAVTFASIYGLVIRLLYGFFYDILEIMSITFLILIPVIIGFLTVIFLSTDISKNYGKAFLLPWITAIVILVITLLFSIEGAICWFMLFPLFGILSGFGGMIAYAIRKRKHTDTNDRDHIKNSTLSVSFALFIPVFLGYLEGEKALFPEIVTVQKEVLIEDTPSNVWKQLVTTEDIVMEKEESFLLEILDFPKHMNTILDTAAVGGKRIATYERGLFFEETITTYDKNKKLVLEVHTDPTKIPPTVMDEHILIGGKHLDILEDTYTLKLIENGHTQVTLSSRFYINTPFNWYARIWAESLMDRILESELERIKKQVVDRS